MQDNTAMRQITDITDVTDTTHRSYVCSSNSSPHSAAMWRTSCTADVSPHTWMVLAGSPSSALLHAKPRWSSPMSCNGETAPAAARAAAAALTGWVLGSANRGHASSRSRACSS
eukprot:GHRQ01023271.1.p1 GENE.GHRQ01023271.1~~GHRQ01023271.1.p1  ORF type:complete len:114 (+),score=23.34 GHRQ01023271.1:210-551(+)